jgi:hypothetical protein
MIHRMADEDWAQCRIPVLMAKAIDKLLEQDMMKKQGVFSRSQLVTSVMNGWFARFEKEFGVFVPRSVIRNLKDFDVMKPFD